MYHCQHRLLVLGSAHTLPDAEGVGTADSAMLDAGAAASTAASKASRESMTPSVRMKTNINDRICVH